MKYDPDQNGYYGEFGGAFIPDELQENISQLTERYIEILESPKFKQEFAYLLRNYAGRPSPLYHAPRLSEKYGATPTGIATAWILRHPAKMQMVAGTTNLGRMAEIVRGSEITLERADWYRLYLSAGHILP